MFDRLVRFSARMDPWAIAVSNGAEHIAYRDFDTAIDRVASALEDAGVRETALAAIAVREPYRHLLLILGCARIGVATVSLLADRAAAMRAAAGATMLLAEDNGLAPDLTTDEHWFATAFARADAVPAPVSVDPAALARVQFSSGATGEPKPVRLSWALVEQRIAHTWPRNFGSGTVMSLVGPESGTLALYLLCWSRGGTICFGSSDPAALTRMLAAYRLDLLLASPVQIGVVLDALPPEASPNRAMLVALSGAHVSPALRDQVSLRLGTPSVAYASTEAGVITSAFGPSLDDANAVGWVVPWSEVEIVDDADAPVPRGAMGRIRVRGSDVIDAAGEYGDADDARFQGGWFYPGDLGRLRADGMLCVDGREDEVMNFGGQKYLPDALERPVRQVPGVADVAAFALDDARGVAQPWLAVVRSGAIDDGAIGRALAIPGLPPVRIAWIDALPRTPLGKVQRDLLRAGARKLGVDSAG